MLPIGLTSLCVLSFQCETGRRCLSHEPTTLVRYFALDVTQTPSAPHNFALGLETGLPNRPKEINFQFHGCKCLARRECAREGHAHRSVRNIAKNSSVERTHRVCVLRSRGQRDRRAPVSDLFGFKPDQTRHRDVICFRSRLIPRFYSRLRSAHDFSALPFDSFARTLVSRYSSR